MENYSHVIKFFDEAEIKLTDEENQMAEALMINGMKGFESKKGGKYKFSSIDKWLPIDEYYQLYPKKRPDVVIDYTENNFLPPPYISQVKQLMRNKKNLKTMIAGFKKHFEGRAMPVGSKVVLNKMEYKLNLLK